MNGSRAESRSMGPCLWRGLFLSDGRMTLALDFPECSQSVVGRLDPRWKLAAIMLAAFAAALLQTLPSALALLGATMLLVLAARLPFRWLALRLSGMALVLAVFLAWLPFIQ